MSALQFSSFMITVELHRLYKANQLAAQFSSVQFSSVL